MQQQKKSTATHKRFMEFHESCNENPKAYSILQTALEVGDNIKELRKWCKSKAGYEDDYFITLSAFRCSINVGRAFTNEELTKEEAENYLIENTHKATELGYFQMQAKEKDKRDEEQKNFLHKYGLNKSAIGSEKQV